MAIMTMTNTTNTVDLPSRIINRPAEYNTNVDPLLGTAGLIALSSGLYGDDKGHKNDPLPYPMNRQGELAAGANFALPVHPIDFTMQSWWETHTPANEWNALVQKGTVSVSFAAETGVQDVFEDLISTV